MQQWLKLWVLQMRSKGRTKSSSLASLRINHTPIMGTAEVNGKNVNMEVIEGGTYKLEVPDGDNLLRILL